HFSCKELLDVLFSRRSFSRSVRDDGSAPLRIVSPDILTVKPYGSMGKARMTPWMRASLFRRSREAKASSLSSRYLGLATKGFGVATV
ncbi:MAG: hypothetical protein AB1664_13640, partial [Thermodesulfobacteriota bacterium]